MGFKDVLKKSFLEGGITADLNVESILAVLAVTAVLGIYIYLVYRIVTRKTVYSESFNISLVALAVITASIILSIQSSVVISLGMVGALSIVRFRTAVKEPMDLIFLFWSISVGIICGAGLLKVAVLSAVIVTLVLLGLEFMPKVKVPLLLVVNAENVDAELSIMKLVKKQSTYAQIKSRNVTEKGMDMIVEVRVKDGNGLIRELSAMKIIKSVALLSHDGELTY